VKGSTEENRSVFKEEKHVLCLAPLCILCQQQPNVSFNPSLSALLQTAGNGQKSVTPMAMSISNLGEKSANGR